VRYVSLLGEVDAFDRVIQTCSARHRQAGFIMVMYVGGGGGGGVFILVQTTINNPKFL